MTDLRQAAQQALEALESRYASGSLERCGDAITALHTALEQQAEPVAWMDREGDLYKMPEIKNWAPPHVLLYTAPTQRPWVGLEAEDLAQIESDEFWQVGNHMAIAMAVEAKLKERNSENSNQ